MDIELYNYNDILMHEYRAGSLQSNIKWHKTRPLETKIGEHLINPGLVVLTMESAPSGMMFKRDNADFMNNLNVNVIARSFTYIE